MKKIKRLIYNIRYFFFKLKLDYYVKRGDIDVYH